MQQGNNLQKIALVLLLYYTIFVSRNLCTCRYVVHNIIFVHVAMLCITADSAGGMVAWCIGLCIKFQGLKHI